MDQPPVTPLPSARSSSVCADALRRM
jgi:hypothetical protein